MVNFKNFIFSSVRVRPKLPCLREAAPLLDLDRDERKLDAFLQLHKGDLTVSDLRIFLPFTINLDPYLRKVLKEDQQAIEDEGIVIPMKQQITPNGNHFTRNHQNFFQPQQQPAFTRALPLYATNVTNSPLAMMNYFSAAPNHAIQMEHEMRQHQQIQPLFHQPQPIPIDLVRIEKYIFLIIFLDQIIFFRICHKLDSLS